MNKKKRKFLKFIYGHRIEEAIKLDELLTSLEAGGIIMYDLFAGSQHQEISTTINRIAAKLIDDNMVMRSDMYVSITSKGKLHLSKGGYVKEIIIYKNASFSFWLSVIAIIVSIISLIKSIVF